MKYDLLHIQGKPYVLVPLHEYRELTGDQKTSNLPAEVLDRLTAREESPLKVLRKHRGLTQKELAEQSGISRPYLTEIETGKKDGSIRAMKALADILKVDLSLLV